MSVRALNWKRVSRAGLAALTGLLAAVLLVRALAALVEALAVLILVLVAASVALPRGLGWYWRRVRGALPGWLEALARFMDSRPQTPREAHAASVQPTTKGKEA